MGAVIALDPSLGLRRARGDDLNPQRRAHAGTLRQGHGPRDLLLRSRHPHIDIFPIRIERQRHAVRHGEFIHLQIPENGTHGDSQAPVQGSKRSGRKHDRQTRILADAEHHVAMLSEQDVRVPVAKDRGRSIRICYDRSTQPPQEFLRAARWRDYRLRAISRSGCSKADAMRSVSAFVRPCRAASARQSETAFPTCAAISRAASASNSK